MNVVYYMMNDKKEICTRTRDATSFQNEKTTKRDKNDYMQCVCFCYEYDMGDVEGRNK